MNLLNLRLGVVCFCIFYFVQSISAIEDESYQADSTLVYSYLNHADTLLNVNTDSARIYINKALVLSDSYPGLKLVANYKRASCEYKCGNRLLADSIFDTFIDLATLYLDSTSLSKMYIEYGHLQYLLRRYEKATGVYDQILPYLENSDQYQLLIQCHINLAKINTKTNQFTEAMNHFMLAMKEAEKHGLTEKLALIYGNMGSLYFKERDYEQGIECFERSLKYHQQLTDNQVNIAVCYQSIGTIYVIQEKYKEAEEYLLKAGECFNNLGLKAKQVTVLNSLGVLYKNNKQYSKALESYKQIIELNKSVNSKSIAADCYNNMAMLYTEQMQYDRALEYLFKCIDILKDDEEHDLREYYENIAYTYQLKNDFKNAYFWLNTYKVHSDSIFNLKKYKETEALRTQFETEKKELAIEQMKLEDEKQIVTIQRNRIIIYGLIFFVVYFFVSALLVYRQSWLKEKSYITMVEKSDQMLEDTQMKLRKALSQAKEMELLKAENNDLKKVLPDDIQKNVIEKITELVDQKFYCDTEMNLIQMSVLTSINTKYLSQTINDVFKSNVPNFINQLRVEEAQRLLKDESKNHLTIEIIGNYAGFKSKSVFNTAFKKVTGVTPSFYKKHVQNA